MAKRTLESNVRPKRSKKEQSQIHRAQVARGRKVSKFSESSWMDKNFADTWTNLHDDQHLPQRNLAPAEPVRKHNLRGIQ